MSMHKKTTRSGDQHIAHVFRLSLAVIVLITVVIAAGWWLLKRGGEQETPVVEAEIHAPAAPVQQAPSAPPEVVFTDITAPSGIDFVHTTGAYGERLMPETMGSGLAFIDYDNDGDQDIFFVDSTYWPGHEGDAGPHQVLYRNEGDGRFTEVSEEAGLALDFFGMGAAVGDYDNDGWDDLFVTAVGANRLFHNDGGRFTEVTASAGVGGWDQEWSTAAAFFDIDNDGDLDLYVGNYVRWSRDIDLEIDFKLTGLGRAYGAPNHFNGVHSYLYRNEGNGTFVDISANSGIQVSDAEAGRPEAKTLGAVPVDYDGDGWMDLFVANDTVRNFLFRNRGDGSFEEIGAFEGIAFDRDGKATGAMGIDLAWYRNDTDLGVAIGNFANEPSSLYVTADGQPPFADEAVIEGLGAPSRLALTFGVIFFDYDLDGRLDLLQANGHLEPEINTVQPSQNYTQPAQLFWNCGEACGSRLLLVEERGALSTPIVGRGAGYADLDGDGDLDLALSQNGGRPLLVRNDQSTGHHWLRVKLEGTRSNRNAIGAKVELTAGGVTQRRDLNPSRSYLTQVENVLTFGLGDNTQVERLSVHWPSGLTQEIVVDGVDRVIEVVEPES